MSPAPKAVQPKAGCPFCEIIAERASARVLLHDRKGIIIEPLKPVVEGHVMVIPRVHVEDFTSSATVSSWMMRMAAEYAYDLGPCNLITSKGAEATQTVFHLHLHIVPRSEGDGLLLPWTAQHEREAALEAATSQEAVSKMFGVPSAMLASPWQDVRLPLPDPKDAADWPGH